MVGPVIDEKVRKFMMALHIKGGHASRAIARTTAHVLLSRSDDLSLRYVVVTDMLGKSVLQRLGFRRRTATTSKVEVPASAKKEAGLQHHYRIVSIVEKYGIPPSLVLNSDQTPSKYVQVGRFTMVPKNTNKVGIAGSSDKRCITLTLTVTLEGKTLPFQIIYQGKTKQSLPKVVFPEGFSLSANLKHHSNTEEVLKHLSEIVIPYVNAERAKLGNLDQFALLIWDVFRGQKTDEVTSLLAENKILIEYVPNNMTDEFQVLDLTVNKWLKGVIKGKFQDWFANQLRMELDCGKSLDDINIKFLLSTMKPVHAGWLIDAYNKLSSSDGKSLILSGWKAAGISEALEKGLAGFSRGILDPYSDIDPFDQEEIDFNITSIVTVPSEEYVEQERVINENDSDDECLPNAISHEDEGNNEIDNEE